MKIRTRLSALLLVVAGIIITLNACKKITIVVPKACFDADKTEINSGDSIVFTSCSVADDVKIMFPREGEEDLYAGPAFYFDSSKTYVHVFKQAGTYTATLRAVNNMSGSPIKEVTKTIIVQ